MNIRERMLAVYNNQPIDRPAIGVYKRYLPRGSKELNLRNAGLGIIDYYPAATLMAPPWHFQAGFLSEVKNTDLKIDYIFSNGNVTRRNTYQTPVGSIYNEVTADAGGVGSEHISSHYIKSIEDYKTMLYIINNTVIRSNKEAVKTIMQDMGEAGVLMGRLDRSPYQKLLIELVGAERFFIDMYEASDIIEELLDVMSEKMLEALEISLYSDADLFWQPDNITCDMTPPSYYEMYCLPFYQKCSQKIKTTGKPYFIHIDGKLRNLAEMIKLSEFSGIESISSPDMGGDMTLAEARLEFENMVLIPNFSSNLCSKSDAEIEESLFALRKQAGEIEPLMLQLSEDIPQHEWQRVLPIMARVFG